MLSRIFRTEYCLSGSRSVIHFDCHFAISCKRARLKFDCVSMNIASDSKPFQLIEGKVAFTQSWKQNWVFPVPGNPTNSVTIPSSIPKHNLPIIFHDDIFRHQKTKITNFSSKSQFVIPYLQIGDQSFSHLWKYAADVYFETHLKAQVLIFVFWKSVLFVFSAA